MEPWGTPSLTGYSYEDFSSKTTWSHLLVIKEEIGLKIWPEISQVCEEDQHAKPRQKPWIYQVLLSSPIPVKSLAIISDTIVRRSEVDWEDLKIFWIRYLSKSSASTPSFYEQSYFDPRPENCLSFSEKSAQKII